MMMTTRSSERAELIRIGKEKDKTLFSLRNFYIEETFSKTKQNRVYGGGIRFGVSFPNQSLAPNLCPSSWMDGWMLPFFLSSNLQSFFMLGVRAALWRTNEKGGGAAEKSRRKN